MSTLYLMLTVMIAIVPILVHAVGKYTIRMLKLDKWTSSINISLARLDSLLREEGSGLPSRVINITKYFFSYILEFSLHPQSVNTTLNSTVTFTCEAVADEINFRVNNISATLANVINKGFTQQPMKSLSGGKKRRVLLAKSFEDNNNTNILCRATNSEREYSDIAVLRIQGELML